MNSSKSEPDIENENFLGIKHDENVFLIPISNIIPDPDQPRITSKEDSREELKESISKYGLQLPIIVRWISGKRFMIVAGERRFHTCKELGYEEIPAKIVDASDELALQLQLTENLQRIPLNPLEEAHAFERMHDEGLTYSEIGRMIGRSKSYVVNKIRLIKLPDEIEKLILKGSILEGHARLLLTDRLEYSDIITIAKKILKENLTVRETKKLVDEAISSVTVSRETKKSSETSNAHDFEQPLNIEEEIESWLESHPIDESLEGLEPHGPIRRPREITLKGSPFPDEKYREKKVNLKEIFDEEEEKDIKKLLMNPIEKWILRNIRLYRGLVKSQTCHHRDLGFCTMWTFNIEHDFFAGLYLTDKQMLTQEITSNPNEKILQLQSSILFCMDCSLYTPYYEPKLKQDKQLKTSLNSIGIDHSLLNQIRERYPFMSMPKSLLRDLENLEPD